WLRLFNSQVGGEISWLLPLAGLGLLAGLWAHRSGARTDAARAAYVLWGVWLLVHAAVFSFASGIFHAYYTVAMAPAVAALVGGGLVDLWRLRSRSLVAAAALAAGLVATAWWGSRLLGRTPSFAPGLGTLELVLAALAAVVLLALGLRGRGWGPLQAPHGPSIQEGSVHRLALAAVGLGAVAVMLGPSAYAVSTVARGGSGPDPSAGPVASTRGAGSAGGPGGSRFAAGGPPPGAFAAAPGGGAPAVPAGAPGGSGRGTADPALISYLERHQGTATWLVAVNSANESAAIQLASGRPVMAMGGFSGSDPALSVARLKALVSSGSLRYVLLGGRAGPGFASQAGPPGGPGAGAGSEGQARNAWITQNCRPVTDAPGAGSTAASGLYDCSSAAVSAA
ncbi:MAG: glycosyl transferase, partial [Candidatus Dormibacteraeota bacterium]|nr:glycosyl transferase [Candidatus Dormibacteraeota bacterium]